MTTIAYKGGVLATDSQCSFGGVVCGDAVKAVQRGRAIATGCGNLGTVTAFLDWFRSGMEGDPPPCDEETSLAIVANGCVIERDRAGWLRVRSDFYAWGSGEHLARGAMAAGATAKEAVCIAAQYDTGSGGPVRTFTL